MPVVKSLPVLFNQGWGKGLEIPLNVFNGPCKILYAVRDRIVILIMQYFIHLVTDKQSRVEYRPDVLLPHVLKPLFFTVLVNTDGYVVQ